MPTPTPAPEAIVVAILGDVRRTLIERRKALGLSQSDAGRACVPAMPQSTVSQIESGTRNVGLEAFVRYAWQALGLDVRLVVDRD